MLTFLLLLFLQKGNEPQLTNHNSNATLIQIFFNSITNTTRIGVKSNTLPSTLCIFIVMRPPRLYFVCDGEIGDSIIY